MERRIGSLLQTIKRIPSLNQSLISEHYTPAQQACYAQTEFSFHERLVQGLHEVGCHKLYTHQALALNQIAAGADVVITTPTASGKSLIYFIPVLNDCAQAADATALFLYPFKALGRDQEGKLNNLAERCGLHEPPLATVYDGDTSSYFRKKIKSAPSRVIITNPDMLHRSILPGHQQWSEFLSRLRWIVLDELHVYRGVFGSHVSWILRRLLRLAHHYGANPQVIACSATIAQTDSLLTRLTGRESVKIEENGAPLSGRHLLILDPEIGLLAAARELFSVCVREHFKTIAFTKSRKLTELLYKDVTRKLQDAGKRVAAYRAGFLPSERREVEARLFNGELLGVISTSALEVGIDVGGLDCCILLGYPGTIVSTVQRLGRVGRGESEAASFLLIGEDALDKYIALHSELLLGAPIESVHIQPENEKILTDHLLCAASEIALKLNKLTEFIPEAQHAIDTLTHKGYLLEGVDDGAYHPLDPNIHQRINIRGFGDDFTIINQATGKSVGSLSRVRAYHEGHKGAVYLHQGVQYKVTRMDLDTRVIYVLFTDDDYYTKTNSEKETQILETFSTTDHGLFSVSSGRLKVTERITEYVRRRLFSEETIDRSPLELPPLIFETTGVWIQIAESVRVAIQASGRQFMGSIHAFEHAALAIFPLISICDRFDVHGISFDFHYQLKRGAVFLYDNVPEGLGIAVQALDRFKELLTKVWEVVQACPCEIGCPRCIYSPRCGAGNRALDKQGMVQLTEILLGKRTIELLPAPEPRQLIAEPNTPTSTQPAVLVLDLETQKIASEVGGWAHCDQMRLALAVVFDVFAGQFEVYYERQAELLIERLQSAALVIGYNLRQFDYVVLAPYRQFAADSIPTLDLWDDVRKRLGFRLKLDDLAKETLGIGKSADGLQSVAWFNEGRLDLVEAYCRRDVEITYRVFQFGWTHNYVIYRNKKDIRLKLPVDWSTVWAYLIEKPLPELPDPSS